jgi:IS30 family transposase
MKKIISVFEEGIPNGKAPDILIHENNLNISTSTSYRYIHQRNMGNVMPVDLKRAVRYKQQDRRKVNRTRIDYDYLNGRRYEDFCNILPDLDPAVNIWEMDTVEGKKGTKKCALSLLYRKTNLQLYFLLEEKTMLEVQRVMDGIKEFLGAGLFAQTFTIILTDNGSEFHDPINLETDPQTGEKLISIYYCRPRHSEQKGKCEKNHEHFREMVPKGTSMDELSKKDMRYVSNNVNNYCRRKLNYKSPYELSVNLLPKKVLALNNLSYLPPGQVKLIPITR